MQWLNQEIMGFCRENPGTCGKTVDLIENSVRIKSIPLFFLKEVTCNSPPRAIILQQHCHIAFLNFSSKMTLLMWILRNAVYSCVALCLHAYYKSIVTKRKTKRHS